MLDFITDITKKTGQIILEERHHLSISQKSRREIVTNADIAAERFLVSQIKEKFPQHIILGEESYDKSKDYSHDQDLWILDPIDGTTNFAQGMPDFGVSVGYYKGQKPVAGIIYFPQQDELFAAEIGKGATMNGKSIHVSEKENIRDAVVGGLFCYEMEKNNAVFDIAKHLYPSIKTMRFLGSAVMDLCYTSCGFLDGTFGYALKPWDMAAGYLIAREAGAKITRLSGDEWNLFKFEILAAAPVLHSHLLKILQSRV